MVFIIVFINAKYWFIKKILNVSLTKMQLKVMTYIMN